MALTLCFAATVPSAPQPPPLGEYVAAIRDLHEPRGAAFAPDGSTVYIADAGAGAVLVVDPELASVVDRWTLGRGAQPVDVAAGPGGAVYVADAGRREVVALSAEGREVRRFGSDRLAAPSGIAVDADRVLVADSGRRGVAVFDRRGGWRRWLTDLGRPVAVAIDARGAIYVADDLMHRVHKLDAAGERLASWGAWGTFPGLLSGPTAIDVAGDRLYVAEAYGHRIQIFTLDGDPIDRVGMHAVVPREGEGRIHYPGGLAVRADGELVVVCEAFERRAQILARHKSMPEIQQLPPKRGLAHYDGAIAAGDGLLVTWEPETRSIIVLDLRGEIPIEITRFGENGSRVGQFGQIAAIAIDGNDIWIADAGNRRVTLARLDRDPDGPLRFDPFMVRFVKAISLEPRSSQDPIEPAGLACPADGVLVLDALGGRIFAVKAGAPPAVVLEGDWARPSAMAIELNDGSAGLVVVERGARRVRAYTRAPGGAWAEDWIADEGLVDPYGVAVHDGHVYVTDAGADAVVRLDDRGREVGRWGATGGWSGEFWQPRGIAVDRDRVIVLDWGNHRGQIFSGTGDWLVSFSAGRAFTRSRPQPRDSE